MQTLRASKCGLSTAQLPSSILDVIDSLTKAGYEAYIVGGGVRDLMLDSILKISMQSPMQHLLKLKKFLAVDAELLADDLNWHMSIQDVS